MKQLICSTFVLLTLLFISCSHNDDDKAIDKNYHAKEFFKETTTKSTQTFNLKTNELPKTITLKGGTKITMKEGSFTKNGAPISGDFTLEVKEVLKRSDILLSGTNTMYADGSPLISDGFLYIDVTQNGVSIDKNLSKNLLVEIPKPADLNRETQLWEGTETAGENENQFAWNNFPEDAIAWNDQNLDREKIGQDFNVLWPQQGSTSFAFNLGKLGWYNCDVLWDKGNGKTTITVNLTGNVGELASYLGYSGNTFVFFCGKGINVIVQLYTLNGSTGVKSYENSMPIGGEGKMIAFSIKEGRFYFDSKDVTITSNLTLNLDLKETTKEHIQQLFEGLDNFN